MANVNAQRGTLLKKIRMKTQNIELMTRTRFWIQTLLNKALTLTTHHSTTVLPYTERGRQIILLGKKIDNQYSIVYFLLNFSFQVLFFFTLIKGGKEFIFLTKNDEIKTNVRRNQAKEDGGEQEENGRAQPHKALSKSPFQAISSEYTQ
jgi:hypothetical protein